MSGKPEEERFSDIAVQLSQAIHYCVTDLFNMNYNTVDPALVLLVTNIMQRFDKHTLIQGFIENSHIECWDKIKKRDEEYFVENASNIFKYLPSGQVNLFKDLFTTKDSNGVSVIDQDTKNQIWKLFDVMIKISIKYVHKNRLPYSVKESCTFNKYYERDFFIDVKVEQHAETWGVVLEFDPRC